eukprot:04746.XXX_12997_13467_1 [CDS] Oithona nana genome sequencing.
MDFKLIIFLLCLIDLSLQGCEYEEAQRLQQNYKRCVDDSSKGSFSWMAAEQADSAFTCSYLTEIFDKCNPLLESCFTKKQVEEMTNIQMKAFNEFMKIGNLDLKQCKSVHLKSESSSSSMHVINFHALLLIIQLLV